jgi:CheY-like chemotaxis protein
VIAMTANALAGDREECLTAGMDDYISKPVRVPELEAAIKRGLNCIQQSRDVDHSLDMKILESVRELRSPGEADPLAELIDLFLQDTPARIANLLDAFKTGSAAELERAAHGLKGSASNLGARGLAAACTDVSSIARAGTLPDASAVARILSEFERLKPALEREKLL